MSYNVLVTTRFKNRFKKLLKTYPSLQIELRDLIDLLKENPIQGISMGQGFYKIRISIASKGKGKRGGGRVITLVEIQEEQVTLITVYSKGEYKDITLEDL